MYNSVKRKGKGRRVEIVCGTIYWGCCNIKTVTDWELLPCFWKESVQSIIWQFSAFP